MKSTKEKVFAAFAMIFFVLVVVSPFITRVVFKELGYTAGDIPIAVMVMMLCSVLLGDTTIIKKEQAATKIGIATCAVGTVCISIFGSSITQIGDTTNPLHCPIRLFWITSGYLLLLLLILATMLSKKVGKQKQSQGFQKVILVLLFGNIVLNIFIAANEVYGFFGIFWDLIYMEIALIINSFACVFWGLWAVSRNKASET